MEGFYIFKTDRILELTSLLNKYRNAYYNNSKSLISDYEYDKLYDELEQLEKETGIIMSNSPTQTVGYEVISKFEKVRHNHPMLSLDKTKAVNDLTKFLGNEPGVLMLKMDGLTVTLRYVDGELQSAETRGNGEIGENILHNAKVFSNIPLHIDYPGELIVDGEAIIDEKTFEKINVELPPENRYKNQRNLASGSVRQLDSSIAVKRNIKFVAWKCVKGFEDNNDFYDRLVCLSDLGFEIVPSYCVSYGSNESFDWYIDTLKEEAQQCGYPIDGLVLTYNDVSYGESLGTTGHHPRHSIAYKFYDEESVTKLLDVEWSMGKTGDLCPVANFAPVEIDGSTITKASLHNVSICKNLQIGIGDEITVYKANAIIPQISDNLTRSNTLIIPDTCPICGRKTEIIRENETEVLRCMNPGCKGKLLGQLVNFVSRKGANIEGLSEESLSKFISWGWINSIFDLYKLPEHFEELKTKEGFGEKSVKKLSESLEKSKEIDFKNFITAICIPSIGFSQAQSLAKYFKTWDQFYKAGIGDFDFSEIEGFGKAANSNIHSWFEVVWEPIKDQWDFLLINPDKSVCDNKLKGKIFVITGNLNHFQSRNEAKTKIELKGGKVTGTVSKKTYALVNNDITSNSSKNIKAKELGVKIITEEDLISMIK